MKNKSNNLKEKNLRDDKVLAQNKEFQLPIELRMILERRRYGGLVSKDLRRFETELESEALNSEMDEINDRY